MPRRRPHDLSCHLLDKIPGALYGSGTRGQRVMDHKIQQVEPELFGLSIRQPTAAPLAQCHGLLHNQSHSLVTTISAAAAAHQTAVAIYGLTCNGVTWTMRRLRLPAISLLPRPVSPRSVQGAEFVGQLRQQHAYSLWQLSLLLSVCRSAPE